MLETPKTDPKVPAAPVAAPQPPQDPKPVDPAPVDPAPVNPAPKRNKVDSKKHTARRLIREIEEEEGQAFDPHLEEPGDEDLDRPLTKRDLQRMEQEKATGTAVRLADSIQDEATRNAVKNALKTRVVPSGNPQQDYQDALDLVHSQKNRDVAAAAGKKQPAQRSPSGSGAPASVEEPFAPTEEELRMVKMGKIPADKQKEAILNARQEIARQQDAS